MAMVDPSHYRREEAPADFLRETLYAGGLAHLFALAEGPGRHRWVRMNSHLCTLYLLGRIANGSVVETGVCQGASTAAFLMAVGDEGGAVTSYDIDPKCRDRVKRNLAPLPGGHLDSWSFVVRDSVEAAASHDDKTVGLLFLDSDHSRKHVERELAAWLPKMRPDGIMAGHDYVGTPGVREAVDGFVARAENAKR